ncbi:hypothetical protein C6P42_000225 [Pichia californica]|nr:hypothetical protein C6P42_000225 [[Candida] californica]
MLISVKDPFDQQEDIPNDLKVQLDYLTSCPISDLIKELSKLYPKDWDGTRPNLKHYIPLLNKIDKIYEDHINKYKLNEDFIAPLDVPYNEVEIITTCINYSNQLLEYSTGRDIYNSHGYVASLMYSNSIDIKIASLKLTCCLSEKFASHYPMKFTLPKKFRYLLIDFIKRPTPITVKNGNDTLSQNEQVSKFKGNSISLGTNSNSQSPTKKQKKSTKSKTSDKDIIHISLYDCIRSDFIPPSSWKSLNYEYFKTGSVIKSDKHGSHNNNKIKKSEKDQTGEGLRSFKLSSEALKKLSMQQIFDKAANVIPKEKWCDFVLHVYMAIAYSGQSFECLSLRNKLVSFKCYSVASAATNITYGSFVGLVFDEEPYLLSYMCDLVNPDNHIQREPIIATLRAFVNISNRKAGASDLMRAMGGNVSHGLLFHILKTILKQTKEEKFNNDQTYMNYIYNILANMLENRTLAMHLRLAGLMGIFLEFLSLRNNYRMTRSGPLHLIELFIERLPDAFDELVSANGFAILINLLEFEVNFAIENPNYEGGAPKNSNLSHIITARQVKLLNFLLRLVISMISTYPGDRMRNLYDSPMLKSIMKILQNPKIFGYELLFDSIRIITTIINNEPTAYIILNESGVIDTFFEKFSTFLLPDSELLLELPDVINAISLNNGGLVKVKESHVIQELFTIFKDIDICKQLVEIENVMSLGHAIDELARHHPELKNIIDKEVLNLINTIPESVNFNAVDLFKSPNGSIYRTQDDENIHNEAGGSVLERWDTSTSATVIQCTLIFLSSMFENSREWKKLYTEVNMEKLFKFITLKNAPFDYSLSKTIIHFKNIIRSMDQASRSHCLPYLKEKVEETIHELHDFIHYGNDNDSYFLQFENSDETSQLIARKTISDLGIINCLLFILSDSYSKLHKYQPNKILDIEEVFGSESGLKLIDELCLFYHRLAVEEVILHVNTPTEVAKNAFTLVQSISPKQKEIGLPSNQNCDWNGTSAKFKNISILYFNFSRSKFWLRNIFNSLCSLNWGRRSENKTLFGYSARYAVGIIDRYVKSTLTSLLNINTNNLKIKYGYIFCILNQLYLNQFHSFGASASINPTMSICLLQNEKFPHIKNLALELFTLLGTLDETKLKQFSEESYISVDLESIVPSILDEILNIHVDIGSVNIMGSLPNCDKLYSYLGSKKNDYTSEVLISIQVQSTIASFIFLQELVSTDGLNILNRYPNKITDSVIDSIIKLSKSAYTSFKARTITFKGRLYPIHAETTAPSDYNIDFLCTLGATPDEAKEILMFFGDDIAKLLKETPESLDDNFGSEVNLDWKQILRQDYVAPKVEPIHLSYSSEYDIDTIDDLYFHRGAEERNFVFHWIKIAQLYPESVAKISDLCFFVFGHTYQESMEDIINPLFDMIKLMDFNSVDEKENKKLSSTLKLIGCIIGRLKAPKYFKMIETIAKFLCQHMTEQNIQKIWFSSVLATFTKLFSESKVPFAPKTPKVTVPTKVSQFLVTHNDVCTIDQESESSVLELILNIDDIKSDDIASDVSSIIILLCNTEERIMMLANSKVLTSLVLYVKSNKTSTRLQSQIINVVRRSVESNYIVKNYIEGAVENSLNLKNKDKSKDIKLFLEENSDYALRNPSLFCEVVEESCYMKTINKHFKSPMISKLYGEEKKILENSGYHINKVKYPEQNASEVMNFLLSELMSISKKNLIVTPLPIKDGEKKTDENDDIFAIITENSVLTYAVFLLQTIAELLHSYSPCKTQFLTFSKKEKNNADNKPRSTALNMLIHKFIAVNPFEKEESSSSKIHQLLSTLAHVCILGLVSSVPKTGLDRDDLTVIDNDVAFARKFTVDILIKIIKENEQCNKTSLIKYGRFVDIINLVRKLCGESIGFGVTLSVNPDVTKNDKYFFAKELMEKKMSNIAGSVLAGLDINFPHTEQVSDSVLKLYSLLGKIKVEYQEAFKADQQNADIEEELYDEDLEEKDDAPDLLKNSTLGMYDMDDVEDEDDFDDDFDDGEFLVDDGIEIILSDNDHDSVEIIDELDDPNDEQMDEDHNHSNAESDDMNDIEVDGDEADSLDYDRHGLHDEQIDFVYDSESDGDDEMIDTHEIADYVSAEESLNSEDDDISIGADYIDGEEIESGSYSESDDMDESDSNVIELELDSADEVTSDSDSDDSAILEEWLEEIENNSNGRPDHNRNSQRNRRASTISLNDSTGVPDYIGSFVNERGNTSIPLPVAAFGGDNSRSLLELTQSLFDRRNNTQIQGLMDFRRMFEPLMMGKRASQMNSVFVKSTPQRWNENSELYPGKGVAFRVIPELMNHMSEVSETICEEHKRVKKEKEREEREKREEENRKQREWIKEREMELARQQNESIPHEEAQDQPVENIYVEIGGRNVDIGGTGIDPEFLLALPDDMRQEVYEQHLNQARLEERERGNIRNTIGSARHNDSGLLEALGFGHPLIRGGGMDNHMDDDDEEDEDDDDDDDDGIEDLEDENDGDDNEESFESESDDEDIMRMYDIHSGLTTTIGGNHVEELPKERSSEKNKKPSKVYFTALVDKPGIAALLKLLFLPQVYYKRELFFKAVAYLCLSKHSRSEVIAIILYILQEGIKDQNSAISVFNQICSRANSHRDSGENPSSIDESSTYPSTCTVISLATQSIDVIQYLLENEPSMRFHFLTDQEGISFMKKVSKKHKLKDNSYKFPINILLNLLDHRVVKEDTNLMDILSRSIQIATRPLPTMISKLDELAKEMKKVPQIPNIPDKSLKQIINILVSDECANKVFQQTIASIQSLSVLENAKNVFPKELSKKATILSAKIAKELRELINDLRGSKKDIENLPSLALFSSGASDQAKLLRVLTALDYLYQSKNTAIDDIEELKQLYKNSALGPLWGALSDCLKLIREDDNMNYIAFILSPLIEALMVVCKHSKVQRMNALDVLKYEDEKELDFAKEPIESLFFTFTQEHKKILNHMIRNNPKLMSGPFSVLIRNPKVLEFDNKRVYFDQKLHGETDLETKEKLPINIRRNQVFMDSYRSIFFKPSEKIKNSQLEIAFNGEEGVDAGGVTREWYQVLSRQIFDPNYALFVPVASDKTTFHPNRTSWVNPEHLSFFKFVGMIIGKAVFDGYVLDCHFSRAVFKRILGKSVSLKDMESLDLDYYKSLVWMLENDITDIIVETFSVETDDYGEHKVIDLIPNGNKIAVTEENKHEYVKAIVEYRLLTSVKEQMDNFLEGFYSMIPKDLVSIFDEQELELLVSGLPDIDVDDWKNNTVYTTYLPSSPQVQWFWRAVKSFDTEERAKLLQFVTGTSKVPLNGFKELSGMNGISKFTIYKTIGSDRLPTAHTCFNQLDLPEYESYSKLRNALLLAIREGHEGFGFA